MSLDAEQVIVGLKNDMSYWLLKLNQLEMQKQLLLKEEPGNRVKLKHEILSKWLDTSLLDILKEVEIS